MRAIKQVAAIRRNREQIRKVRELRAARSSSDSLAQELPPLMQWIPTVSPDLDEPVHLEPITDLFERAHRGEEVECCVSVPPRHGKTVTALHGLVWLLAQHPDWPILFVSYSLNIAKKMVWRARKIALSAGIRLGGVQTREYWETAAGGGIRASGLGGQLIGDGFRFIFVDDPHKNRKEAESATIRTRVVDGFWSDIYTRKMPAGTSTIVNHQRWHQEDLIGSLTTASETNKDPFAIVNLPAINSRGEPLAPKLWSIAKLEKIRSKDEYAWSSMYQGEPRPKGGTLFTRAPTITNSRPQTRRSSVGADLARSAKQRSDFHAMVHIEWLGEIAVIVDAVYQRGHITDQVLDDGKREEGACGPMHRLQVRAGGAPARWYAGRDETTYKDLLEAHRTTPVYLRVEKADSDKWVRSQAYAAAWNSGLVYVLETCRYKDEILKQHRGFTGKDGESDDLIDACVAAWDEGQLAQVPTVIGVARRVQPMVRRDGRRQT